jgi:hypothetical protein
MKVSAKNLTRVLDALVTTPAWAKAMGVIKASESPAFVWRAKSREAEKENDRSSLFFLEWRQTWDFWHNHAGRARNENILLYEAAMRDESLHGREEIVLGPDQKPVYLENEKYIGKDDTYVELSEGCDPSEVGYYRWARDEMGRRIPLTRKVFPPAPLRLAVLKQNPNYIERSELDVNLRADIQHAKPLLRRPDEPAPNLERLRRLAALPPAERRAELGAKAFPQDANGRHVAADVGAPSSSNKSTVIAPNAPRPNYARPVKRLDQQDRRGEPPPGGYSVTTRKLT